MDTKKRNLITNIAVTAGLSALIVIMGLTHIGFIPWFSGAAITIMQIPVIICAMLCGWIPGSICGAVFGIFSLIVAATSPTGATDALFASQPWIPIVPRVLMGLFAGLIYLGFSKLPKFPQIVNFALTGFIGSLLNTVFVLACFVIVKAIDIKLALAIAVSNGLLEGAASAIICTAVMCAIKLPKKKSKFSDKEEDEE